ncbi:H/ACA ribonucleoprotein complex subunit 1 [Nematocida minor]|uniref:H/ACA ribonucleoprotein complex subunit 1 n=1 Tax=Nematocida minor TaxID=1912983 RepID=UPI0022204BFA|nr:H/ACA ribonucleoprotein complex subunit 1 [Nematocida minor]KAI5192951.1 H/ACA ribonucleoprotein complex subunit 1 [Nematocida minor]
MARATYNKKPNSKTPRDFPQMRHGKRENREDPANFIKLGEFSHPVKNTNMIVIKLTESVIPYFNAGVYGEGDRKIADIHEIFGKFNDHVYASIAIDSKLDASTYNAQSLFRADKFKCLSFDRVKGASQMAKEGVEPKKAKNLPQQFNRGSSSKFRTNAQNERVKQYATSQINMNRRDSRDKGKREEFMRKTIEKRGPSVKIHKKKTFTYDE